MRPATEEQLLAALEETESGGGRNDRPNSAAIAASRVSPGTRKPNGGMASLALETGSPRRNFAASLRPFGRLNPSRQWAPPSTITCRPFGNPARTSRAFAAGVCASSVPLTKRTGMPEDTGARNAGPRSGTPQASQTSGIGKSATSPRSVFADCARIFSRRAAEPPEEQRIVKSTAGGEALCRLESELDASSWKSPWSMAR